MRFDIGERVKLTKVRSYSDGTTIPVGAKGTVTQVYEPIESYLVEFDDYSPARRVHEKFLAAA